MVLKNKRVREVRTVLMAAAIAVQLEKNEGLKERKKGRKKEKRKQREITKRRAREIERERESE